MKNVIDEFPVEVIQELKNYVYRLIDPRNGETFYVARTQFGDKHNSGDIILNSNK